jgi:hypothetical protein
LPPPPAEVELAKLILLQNAFWLIELDRDGRPVRTPEGKLRLTVLGQRYRHYLAETAAAGITEPVEQHTLVMSRMKTDPAWLWRMKPENARLLPVVGRIDNRLVPDLRGRVVAVAGLADRADSLAVRILRKCGVEAVPADQADVLLLVVRDATADPAPFRLRRTPDLRGLSEQAVGWEAAGHVYVFAADADGTWVKVFHSRFAWPWR